MSADERQSAENDAHPTPTCADLGCVNGRTIQGRVYDYDGTAEDQWAPCGRRLATCPIPPGVTE